MFLRNSKTKKPSVDIRHIVPDFLLNKHLNKNAAVRFFILKKQEKISCIMTLYDFWCVCDLNDSVVKKNGVTVTTSAATTNC